MLTIYATVKNESDQILEWLAFHKLQGFEHFILCLDNCSDNTQELIEKSQFSSICEIIDINSIIPPNQGSNQIYFFRHALSKMKDTKWAIPIDVDEYIYSPQGFMVSDVLKDFDASGVAVCQRVFGSSNLETRNKDNLVIETFTKHVNDDLDLSNSNLKTSDKVDPGFIKVFVQPKDVLTYGNAHFPVTKTPFVYEDKTKFHLSNRMGWTKYRPMNILRINHYFAQDKTYWDKKNS